MLIKELDIVQLKNGCTATVLDVFHENAGFLVEIMDEHGKTLDILSITKDDIAKIVWTA